METASSSSSTPGQGLGRLSILPPDIRTLVWLEFLPAGREDEPSAPAKETDLRVLRTSKFVYHEVSAILYASTSLLLDVLPTYTEHHGELYDPWCAVRFDNIHCHDEQTLWLLRDGDTKEDTSFDSFPFHKFRSIQVNLYAPGPDNYMQTISLWRNIIRLVRLLKEAVALPSLALHLEKYESHDWFRPSDEKCARYIPVPEPGLTLTLKRDEYFFHDMVILPFCYLENLKTLDVKAHSGELDSKLNRRVINWAKSLVENKPDGYYIDLEKRTGEDYIWMEICIDLDKREWLREEVIKFVAACGCKDFLMRVNSFTCLACMELSDFEDDSDE